MSSKKQHYDQKATERKSVSVKSETSAPRRRRRRSVKRAKFVDDVDDDDAKSASNSDVHSVRSNHSNHSTHSTHSNHSNHSTHSARSARSARSERSILRDMSSVRPRQNANEAAAIAELVQANADMLSARDKLTYKLNAKDDEIRRLKDKLTRIERSSAPLLSEVRTRDEECGRLGEKIASLEAKLSESYYHNEQLSGQINATQYDTQKIATELKESKRTTKKIREELERVSEVGSRAGHTALVYENEMLNGEISRYLNFIARAVMLVPEIQNLEGFQSRANQFKTLESENCYRSKNRLPSVEVQTPKPF